MRDFLHQELAVGDYVVKMGRGNGPAEYGMILHRVDEITNTQLVTSRLSISYAQSSYPSKVVSHKTARINKQMTVVKVTPHPAQVKVFENPAGHEDLIGTWLHGQKTINWDSV